VDPKNLENMGLTSRLLKDIISSLPRVRAPVKELLGIVNLKKAAEGKKELMWIDPERYPAIIDSDMVSLRVTSICMELLIHCHKSLQVIEVELMDELKSSNVTLCRCL
jgi:DNA mismatch repair protein MSH3